MVESASSSELPIVLIVHTPATQATKDRLIDALKLKEGEKIDM